MRTLLAVMFPVFAVLWTGCKSHQEADLARNAAIYEGRSYVARTPGDRPVYILPLTDGRQAMAAAAEGFPVSYDSDGRWQRPVDEMVGEVLQREVIESGVFSRLLDAPDPCQLVLRPTLTSFLTGAMEEDTGGRSLADVKLRVEVWGPVEADGKRRLVHDQIHGERQISNVALVPPSPYLMAGRALRQTMAQALASLDKSGVARTTGSPLAPDRLEAIGIPATPAPTPAPVPAPAK